MPQFPNQRGSCWAISESEDTDIRFYALNCKTRHGYSCVNKTTGK